MAEHLSNAIHWHAILMLNALFPFLVLFGAHILSFYERKVV